MKLDLYRDAAGDPRARGRGAARTVAGFLESDLQDSPEAAREVLRAVDDVESGRRPSWERTGNAYTLTLSPEGARLREEAADEAKPRAVTLAALRQAVADWAAFLAAGARS